MNHYDVTMDILSNIITYCDILMEPKSSVHYVISTKRSAQNGIYTGDLGIEIPFKSGKEFW